MSQHPRTAEKTIATRSAHAEQLSNAGKPVRQEPRDPAVQHCSSSEQAERRHLPCELGGRHVPRCCESILGARLEESEQSSGPLDLRGLQSCRDAPKILFLQRWGCEATRSGAPAGTPLRFATGLFRLLPAPQPRACGEVGEHTLDRNRCPLSRIPQGPRAECTVERAEPRPHQLRCRPKR